MVVLATLLGALLTAATPASAEPTFTRAYLAGFFTRDSLCFDSPVDLDWEAIARREFKEFPVDDPPQDELPKHTTEAGRSSFFKFSAALPDSLRRLHFYLISEAEPRPIVPERLFGIIQYPSLAPDKYESPLFTGMLCLPIPEGVDNSGVVAASKVPLSWRKEPATLVRSGSSTRVRLQSGSAILPPPGITQKPLEVKTAYILSSAELAPKYLVVRRVPDNFCEFTYDVYHWKQGLPVIVSNPDGCDI